MDEARILIVEDERIIALDLVARLRRLGFEVVGCAARADEALALADVEHPDLVLMDIHLEGEADGIAAARALHEQTRIPVVFLTAYADPDTLARAQATLPFGYLLKPCQNAELNAAIRVALARREAEAKLERSEERQRLALDAARLGVWEWDADSGVFSVGGHLSTILGTPPETFVETCDAFLARVHPDDRPRLQLAFTQAQAQTGSGTLDLVFRVVREGDAPVWVETHARAYAATAVAPARVIGVLKDITERRQLELKLRQAAAVFEATAEGIFMMDGDQVIVSVNPAFSALTGYHAEEAVGRDADALLQVERGEPRGSGAAEQGPRQGEARYRRKDGETIPVWESIAAVQPEQGGRAHYIAVFTDITALQRAQAELHHLAHYDPLTGLPNRLLFLDRLGQVLGRAQRSGERCAVLIFDLDDFKAINDTLGHASGDRLLQIATARLQSLLRPTDTLARLGGDEFVILLDGIERPEDVARLARRQLDTLAQPFELDGQSVSVSASLGVSLHPDDGGDVASLLKAADTALYQAKAGGRDRYCFHTPEMAAHTASRMGLEQGLRQALQHHALQLHYQPQVDLGSGELTGVEALLRWQHPQEGWIPPERFIPVAEAAGLIQPLGDWVLENACAAAAQWQRDGWRGRLAVNVSGRQLASEGFADTVRQALARSGLPPARLEIEITESSLLAIERNHRVLADIKRLGVQIAIDDFGTGYSSLSALKHLPIDRLKIDRSFVRDLPGGADDVAIAHAVAALARTLGLKIIAEGVETTAQLDALRELGCDEGQGYLFGRPAPASAIAALHGQPAPWLGLFPAR